jgi:biotin synthase-like enzyme
MRRIKRKTKISLDNILEIALLIAMIPIMHELFVIEEVIRNWINKPQTITFTNIGYYKCGGTNKNPKFCPIILKEKYSEE